MNIELTTEELEQLLLKEDETGDCKIDGFEMDKMSPTEVEKTLDFFYCTHAPRAVGAQEGTCGAGGKQGSQFNGLDVVRFDLPGGDVFFFVVDGGKPLSYVAVTPFGDSYAIGNVRKLPGKFKIEDLYAYIARTLGKGSLYSDKAQTVGGKKIWAKISNKECIDGPDGKKRWKMTV